VLTWGSDGSPSRKSLGPLPKTGEWVRLEVPVQEIGLSTNTPIHGLALTQYDGTVTWDKIGLHTTRDQNLRKSTSVWNLELPDQWLVMTRDVYNDFGDLDITGVILRTPDGQRARFDHIYFARAGDDFQLLPQAPPPEITNQNARRELARSVLERGHPATVAIEIEDRLATGVLVGGEGHVLTAGHLLVAPGKAAIVHLPDGHQLPAKTLGICRSADLGLVQITDRQDAQLQGLDLHDQRDFTQADLYVGFAIAPFVEETPGAAAHVVGLKQAQPETLWTDFLRDDVTTGGPLLARDGRIIGTHVGRSTFGGGFLYTKSIVARENWERMKSGEIYGQWFPGSGPIFGVVINSAVEGAKIVSVTPDTPAAAADIRPGDLIERIDGQAVGSLEEVYRTLAARDPGMEVTLDINRGGQKLQPKMKLVPRVP
jgi:S1-C subfamily serine protease